MKQVSITLHRYIFTSKPMEDSQADGLQVWLDSRGHIAHTHAASASESLGPKQLAELEDKLGHIPAVPLAGNEDHRIALP